MPALIPDLGDSWDDLWYTLALNTYVSAGGGGQLPLPGDLLSTLIYKTALNTWVAAGAAGEYPNPQSTRRRLYNNIAINTYAAAGGGGQAPNYGERLYTLLFKITLNTWSVAGVNGKFPYDGEHSRDLLYKAAYNTYVTASLDADAFVQRTRVVADGGTVTDAAFVSNLVNSLKAGPNNCYAALKGLWVAAAVKNIGNSVQKIYDISPAKAGVYYDATLTGTAQTWTAGALDGKPAITFTAGLGCYSTPSISSTAQPGFIFSIARKDGGGTTIRNILDTNSANRWLLRYSGNATNAECFAGGSLVTGATTQSTFAQFTATLNDTTTTLRRKGSQIATGSGGTNTCSGVLRLGAADTTANVMNGPICLWAIATGLSDPQRDYIEGLLNNTLYPSSV